MRSLMMKRKVKNKMIKGNLLREKIDACGFKLVYVAKQVGVSYQAFLKKLNNETEFKASEVMILKELLHLTDDEVKKISDVIDASQTVEGDLRREIALNIKRLQEIGCYRGIRHRRGLPVRGQNTKNNARTRKGPKRTVANKKK